MSVVIGIDPGLANTGYAVVEGGGSRTRLVTHGLIRTEPATPHARRLRALHDGIATVVAEHAVESAAIESWFVHPVSKAAMGMAEARGAVLVAIAGRGLDVEEYSPNSIKQAVTGSGRADKAQVRTMVNRLLGAALTSDHTADAAAVAICHLGSAPLRRAIGG
ncbi:MAG: crossover junction endodeoxyribonuclease RuvC [Actinobacteria bacterium]|nr:crossover junction endodeoxyribonuclease RuvC [Actinomycetota bacterium]